MSKIPQVNLPIFIGYRCNYSCQDCSAGSDFIKNTQLDPTLEEIMSAIPILAEKFEVQSMISLHGGEPFLYWDEKVVPLAIELNRWFPDTTINIFTNGHLIGKNLTNIFDLVSQINNISFTISAHLKGDLNSKVGQQWSSSINELISHPSIVKIHDEHYHFKDNIRANIYFHSPEYWSSHYVRHPNGQIKPHATNNPEKSMEHGCLGSVCSSLHGTKLYKCGRLGNLADTLRVSGQLDDPDWQKYLNYQPIDLLDINQIELDKFVETYHKPISVCDMCQGSKPKLKWTDRTWDMVFTKGHP